MDDANFYDLYFEYVGKTEVPLVYHRWSMVPCIGALLGRQCWFQFGHWTVYPNHYVMFVGDPANRKTTALRMAKPLLKAAGYTKFSANKSSMERFIADLVGWEDAEQKQDDVDELLELCVDEPSEQFICTNEFVDFVGIHNLPFLTTLSDMWDADDEYRHPKFHGRSIIVPQPTVNILACTQPEMLYKAFPPEAIGQGVCSRFILIFAEPTGIRITWPQKPSKEVGQALVTRLEEMKRRVRGEITLSQGASAVFDTIYQDYQGIRDPRFKHYNGRRFTHLIKLSMVIAAMDLRTEIDAVDVVRANTMLHVAEMRMPNALGEFGEGKNSSLGSKIIALLVQEGKPMTSKRIFQDLANDIHNEQQLLDTLKHLSVAEKIRTLKSPEGKIGYVPNKVMPQEWKKDLIDLSFLSPEEIM